MATEVEAPKEIVNTDPDWFDNVDLSNIALNFTQYGLEIVKAKNTRRKFTIKTPMLELAFPKVTGEGTLGETYGDGKESKNNDRSKATFELTLRMGLAGMDDEIREIEKDTAEQHTVLAQQRRYFQKMFEIGRAILGMIYDKDVHDFAEKIEEARKAVRERRLIKEQALKTGIETDEQLLAAMETDEKLRDEVTADYRERFINDAVFMFENPATFDESGCKSVVKKGENKIEHLQVKAKRKVWQTKEGITQKEAKNLPAYKGEPVTAETWPALLAEASKTHNYNTFSYFDPVGGDNGLGAYLDHQKYTPDPSKPDEKVIDPFWSPFKDQNSLVSTELYFGAFSIPKTGYGVNVKPYKKLTIWRQKEYKPSTQQLGFNMALAGGFKRKASEVKSAVESDKRAKIDEDAAAAAAASDHSHDDE